MTAGVPKTAMVLAAGLGLRLRPLTERMPKALVKVGGKAMIDHALDGLRDAGVERVVVNVHAFADQLEHHLKARRDLDILISDERALRLETGGGVKKARALLGEGPIWVANSDYAWISREGFRAVARAWDPARMDGLLLLVPRERAMGHRGAGDFLMAENGRLTRGPGLVYSGAQILKTDDLAEILDPVFSLNLVWDRMIARGRLFGLVHPGGWCDVGRPESLPLAEALAKGAGDV